MREASGGTEAPLTSSWEQFLEQHTWSVMGEGSCHEALPVLGTWGVSEIFLDKF